MDNRNNFLLAIDIGTTKVCTIIGVKTASGLEIIGVGSHPSHGLKKGSVVNIDKTVKSIQNSIEEAKLMAGVEDLPSATIGIAGSHIYCFNSTGVVPVKGKEISRQDVERVLDAAKAVVIPAEREILHVIPQEFRIDNAHGIKDPVGMCGVRLEAHVHIVTGTTALIQNLTKCVEQAGVVAGNIILQPIASSKAVLTDEEKELGVVLIDIGGGTTDIAIWHEGSLVHTQIIPVGGNHFTNDLAVALKIPHNEAERIKINYGSVIPETTIHSHVTVQGLSGTKPREVSSEEIYKVLGARAEELFSIVKDIVAEKDCDSKIRGGYVLTGGGSQIGEFTELAEYILERPVKIGFPQPFGGMTNIMQNPKFSTVLGLLQDDGERKKVTERRVSQKKFGAMEKDIISKFSDSIKNVFKDIF